MEDSVFVSGLPENVTEAELAQFFGSIGVIKVVVSPQLPNLFSTEKSFPF